MYRFLVGAHLLENKKTDSVAEPDLEMYCSSEKVGSPMVQEVKD